MKTAIIFVLAAVLIAPLACAALVCPAVQAHDCCPKAKSFAPCPLDILDTAKAALPAVVAVAPGSVVGPVAGGAPVPAPSFEADSRDLHLHNHVLRI